MRYLELIKTPKAEALTILGLAVLRQSAHQPPLVHLPQDGAEG